MSDESFVVGVYSVLLALYPRRFRREYGPDMVELVREQCRDEPTWRVLARAAADLAITVPTQHLESHMNENPVRAVPVVFAGVAGAGAIVALVGGSNRASLWLGVAIAVTFGVLAALAWSRSAPVSDRTPTASWWKVTLSGPVLVVAVVLGAGLGVEAWFAGILLVVSGLALTALGLGMGVAHAVTTRRGALAG